MIKILLVLASIIYAYSRATTEAITFEWKACKKPKMSIGEYHFWTLMEMIGYLLLALYCLVTGYGYNNGLTSLIARYMAIVVAFYAIYYPVYTIVFNRKRKQEWYYYDHYKLLEWEIPYPPAWVVGICAVGLVYFL